MQKLLDTVVEVYHDTNEIKTTAMELDLPPNKVKKLLITAGVLKQSRYRNCSSRAKR